VVYGEPGTATTKPVTVKESFEKTIQVVPGETHILPTTITIKIVTKKAIEVAEEVAVLAEAVTVESTAKSTKMSFTRPTQVVRGEKPKLRTTITIKVDD
jgi:hypothetical protein